MLLSCATEVPPFESDSPGYLIWLFTRYGLSGNVSSPRSAFRKNLVRLAELDSPRSWIFPFSDFFLCTEATGSMCKLPVIRDEFASMLWCFSWYGCGSWIKSLFTTRCVVWWLLCHSSWSAISTRVWFAGLPTAMPESVFVTHVRRVFVTHVRRVGGRDWCLLRSDCAHCK